MQQALRLNRMPSGNAEERQWESSKSTLFNRRRIRTTSVIVTFSSSSFKGTNKQVKLTLLKVYELVNDI